MCEILIVDDDPELCDAVCRYFEDHQLSAMTASDRASLQRRLATSEPRLILLDLQLGRDNGLDVLREIRASSDIPVIIMTGHRLEEADRIIGLELGADDYIVKPVGLRELVARVRAVLRREEMARLSRIREPNRGGYKFNGWQLDRSRRQLKDPNGDSVPLSKNQYALLIAFLDAPGRPLSREYLLQATRVHEDVFDRSVDAQVLRLRRKLERDPAAAKMILTERGVGYLFACNVQRH